MAFHWYGVCGLGTKFDTLATTVGEPAGHFLAQPGDVLRHLDDAVQIVPPVRRAGRT